ncbi:ABC transporter substrate-binding protein [Rhodococcus sp. P1Y]|nr:ABC transporter substrate-binding protein [Rhodococcus sp. P1Y]
MCLIVVTSCSGGAASPTAADAGDPVRGGEIVYSYNTDAQSVDPATCAVGIGLAPCQAIYGALLYLDVANNEFEPGMAESVTSADGKVWTLKLRPGMTFTDGTPFDAAAVEYNWNRILDPANLSPGAATASRLKWAVIDPLTVEITSAEVNYRLELAFTEELAFIASPTALQQMGRDFGNSPVGAGPFTFTSWARGTEMVLDRNPNYWDQPRPYVDRVVMKTIGADDQRFNALQAGEVDVMTVTLGKYADRARDAGMSVTQADLLGGGGVRLAQRGALADPDVRRAVSTLIDNDQMIAAVFPGEKTAATFAAEGTELYDPEATWPKRDVAQAQKTIDDYRARNGGEPIRLRYVTVAGSPLLAQVSEMLQAQIEEVDGIEFEIAALDGAAFASALNAGDWDLIVSGLGGANGERLYRVFHTNGTANNSGYSNPVVDAALDTTHSSNDPDEVNAAYKTAIRELMNTGAYKFWQPATTRLLSPSNVGGLEVAYQYWFRPDLAWVNQ